MDREKIIEILKRITFQGHLTNETYQEYIEPIADEICNQWISVEDRLPEKNQQVLIYEHGRISETFYVRSHAKEPTQWETLPFITSYGYPAPSDWHNVTHWQPLPVSPEDR